MKLTHPAETAPKHHLISRQGTAFAALTLGFVLMLTNSACKLSNAIKNGSQVSIDYTLTVDGNEVDSSKGKQPLVYVAGSGQIIPGLDEALLGLKKGDKKQVVIPPEKGYGQINPKALQRIPKSQFGSTKGLQVGAIVRGQEAGRPIQAKVVKIEDKFISLDMNHPLAGKTLNFDVEVVDVKAAEKAAPSK